MSVMQFFSKYGMRGLYFDVDDVGGEGGSGDQTNWKQKYEELNGKISVGEYVAKSAYVALQQKLEQAVNDRKAKDSELGETLARVTLLTKAEEDLKAKVGQFESKDAEYQEKLNKAEARLERNELIFKQFPALAPFEADGLLPEVSVAELPEKLAAFQEKWFGDQKKSAEDFKKGASEEKPPSKDGENKRSAKSVQQEMFKASLAGNKEEYEKLRLEHQELLKEESAK